MTIMHRILIIVSIAVLLQGKTFADAMLLKQAVDEQLELQQAAKNNQNNIDALDAKTNTLLQQYRDINRQIAALDIDNTQLTKRIAQQQQTLANIQQQLDNYAEIQRELIPFMLTMIKTLAQFVALDLPFLQLERQQRITALSAVMDTDASLADKYRRIINAYQIEIEYGRTLETYHDTITLAGQEYTVDILRVGRLLLLFQTRDGKASGHFNRAQQRWEKLAPAYNRAIKKGLQIAKKQSPPELIKLPINIATP